MPWQPVSQRLATARHLVPALVLAPVLVVLAVLAVFVWTWFWVGVAVAAAAGLWGGGSSGDR